MKVLIIQIKYEDYQMGKDKKAMKFIYATYNQHCNSIDITTFDNMLLRIDCNKAEDGLMTTPNSQCGSTFFSLVIYLPSRILKSSYLKSVSFSKVAFTVILYMFGSAIPLKVLFLQVEYIAISPNISISPIFNGSLK